MAQLSAAHFETVIK